MAEETKEQESGQKQEPEQEPGQEQEQEEKEQEEGSAQEAEEASEQDKPEEEKKEGLLMPILYALLAGVGACTLVLILGIVGTFLFNRFWPSEAPPEQPSSPVTLAPTSARTPAADAADIFG